MVYDEMYKMKRAVHLPDKIPLSDTMYSVKSYHLQPSPESVINGTNSKESAMTMESLRARQEDILKKLNQIKEKLGGLKNTPIDLIPSTCQPIEFHANEVITDFVISANPQNPPYSLLLLQNVLKSKLHVLLSSSLHSSVNQIDPSLLKLFRSDETRQRENHHVAFTVIWKTQPMTSLMVNPLVQCEILGEANILRYFSRLFPDVPLLRYESLGPICASEVDDWLDRIQNKVLLGSNKERQAFLKSLNSVLDSSSGITGNSLRLCDLFLWSAILQLGLNNSVPRNISSWFKKISSESGLEELVPEDSEQTATKEGIMARKDFEQFLKKNGIPFQCRDHEMVFTVQALMECVKDMPGIHMKNLFLKDKKGNLFLLAVRHDVQVKLNEIGTQISCKDLRFADEDKLFETLGVKQGCVTLYALINDPSHKVTLLLDSHITQPDVQSQYINFHPLANDATLGITAENIMKFVKLTGHKMIPVKL